jgi:hypothetical protein
MAATALLMAMPLFAQSMGQGTVVVTVLPKVDGQPLPSSVTEQDLAVKVNGKSAKVTQWKPFAAPNNQVELVLLIDSGARTSLGREMSNIEEFVKGLPPNVKAGIAYMTNGRADFVAPLSLDHAAILKNLHLPGGSAGSASNPYFCLSDLARNWPGQDREARREVVMVTEGVGTSARVYDPQDTYVLAAIKDAVRAHLTVDAIFWREQGREGEMESAQNVGQDTLSQVTQATGGRSFWQGQGNPVSFQPYFEELMRRLRNQYELGFTATVRGKSGVEAMKLKLHAPGADVEAPEQVFMSPVRAE